MRSKRRPEAFVTGHGRKRETGLADPGLEPFRPAPLAPLDREAGLPLVGGHARRFRLDPELRSAVTRDLERVGPRSGPQREVERDRDVVGTPGAPTPYRIDTAAARDRAREAHVHRILHEAEHVHHVALARTVATDEDGHGLETGVLIPAHAPVVRDADPRDPVSRFFHSTHRCSIGVFRFAASCCGVELRCDRAMQAPGLAAESTLDEEPTEDEDADSGAEDAGAGTHRSGGDDGDQQQPHSEQLQPAPM